MGPGFKYERDLMGSDFVDLVTAAVEGRGDCDSRSLLLAVVLQRANADAILMVSREYGHAMAAVKVEGNGAKFTHAGNEWIVGDDGQSRLGNDRQERIRPNKWIGIDFPALPPAEAGAK
jgi:hypothetical protein